MRGLFTTYRQPRNRKEIPKNKPEKQRSAPTQLINSIKHKKQISKLNQGIRQLSKQTKQITKQKSTLQQSLIKPKLTKKLFTVIITLLLIAQIILSMIALICCVTIIFSPVGLAVFGVVGTIGRIKSTFKMRRKSIIKVIKSIQDKIKNLNEQLKIPQKQIMDMQKTKMQLKNASLMSSRNQS